MKKRNFVIKNIGKNDAYYDDRKQFQGAKIKHIGTGAVKQWKDNGWFYGDFILMSEVTLNKKTLLVGRSISFHEVSFKNK